MKDLKVTPAETGGGDLPQARATIRALTTRVNEAEAELERLRTATGMADQAGADILSRMHRAHALTDVSSWHVYESQDTGDVYPADAVRDLMADIRAALDGTGAADA